MSRDWRLFAGDIRDCCARIEAYVRGMTQTEFQADEKTVDAVVRNLEVIGEAAKNLPEAVRRRMPEIDWRKVAGLRDILIHAYFGIDEDILWDVVSARVPEVGAAVRRILEGE